jgi:hypothetical protein
MLMAQDFESMIDDRSRLPSENIYVSFLQGGEFEADGANNLRVTRATSLVESSRKSACLAEGAVIDQGAPDRR